MKHPRTSRWFKDSNQSARNLEPGLLDWLSDQGSLTQRLRAHCPNRFSLRLLDQHWTQARVDEARLLGIPLRQRVLLRQVQLCCNDRVLVYARSIIPLKTLKGRHRRLHYLGERPLGAYLFANPKLKRKQAQLASLLPTDPLFQIACQSSDTADNTIWGRRSVFEIDHKPLLVSEFFLPALFNR